MSFIESPSGRGIMGWLSIYANELTTEFEF